MNLLTYPTIQEAAEKLVEKIEKEVEKANDFYHMALSGGVSALPIYKALSESKIDWKKVHFYFAHEIVSGPQKGFCALLAQKHLFDKIACHPDHIHPVDISVGTPDEMAEKYAKHIHEHVPAIEGKNRFDIVLMGIHDDGHTLGYYPGDESFYDSDAVFIAKPEMGTENELVTLTFEALGNCKSLCFYAFGDSVRFVVGNIINLMPQAKVYPANYVAALYPWIYLYADKEAMREKSYSIY